MNNYELIYLENDRRVIVLSTSYTSPLDSMHLISEKLSNQLYSGEVLFDLLLSNGFAPNRFIVMNFDGDNFLPKTTKIINEVSDSLLNEIYAFYFKHSEYVDQSILPETQKYMLKNNKIANC